MKSSIGIQRLKEMLLGKVIFECAAKEVCCLVHKQYTAKKPPRTKKGIKDGCTCWMAWGLVNAKQKELGGR